MLMLSAYMDETGHSKDERQRFNGMAGVIAPADNWEAFETKWKATLKEFGLPFFHMKDFEYRDHESGERVGFYKGWNEAKRRKLFGKLMTHMETVYPIAIGVIIPMKEYREFTPAEQGFFQDPYYFCFLSVIAGCTTFLEFKKAPIEEKIALVFSDQVEFRNYAMQLWGMVEATSTIERRCATPPDFRDMRELVPLQAADIVAYEAYKEHDRLRHRPHAQQRYGYKRIAEMNRRHGFKPMFTFHSKATLRDYVEYNKGITRQFEYEDKKRRKSSG